MANKVPERVTIPTPRLPTSEGVRAWGVTLVRVLTQVFIEVSQRLNIALPKDGTEAMTAPLGLVTFTVATLPPASDHTGAIIFVSDGAAGSKFRGSDGTSWLSLG